LRFMVLIEKYGMVAYIAISIIAIIFNVLDLEIINTVISITFDILYFIILSCGIVSFYRYKNKNRIAKFLFFLPIFLLFTGIPFKVITMILVLPLFLLKGLRSALRAVGILIYASLILVGILGICLSYFVTNKVIDKQYSPSGIYRTITIDSDQGALGGDTFVVLEKIYFGNIARNTKTLYEGDWGEKPEVIWVDDNNVKINGTDIPIN